MLGTLGYFDGEDVEEPTHTTPPADRIAGLLARMAAGGCTHAVLEVSSHALAQFRVAGIEFDAACVTNITRDHLDYHGKLEEYHRAKARLLSHLRGEAFAVINADDPVSCAMLQTIDGPALTIGIRQPAEITGTPLEQAAHEQVFLITAGNESIAVRTAMIGQHHIYNCLSAAAIGLTYGLDLAEIVRALEAAEHVPGRLERIDCGQPFHVFVDFAHTPAALEASLRTLRSVTPGRLICVFGAGGERDRLKRPAMGSIAEREADAVVLTNDNPRQEDPFIILGDILSGFDDPSRAEIIPDRVEAIEHALGLAQSGDAVLIAGKGHEQQQRIGNRSIEHDDRTVARDWLYRMQPFAANATTAKKPRSPRKR